MRQVSMRCGISSVARRVALAAALCASSAVAQREISWQATAEEWRRMIGTTISVYCPPTQSPGGQVWGSIVYTDDSSICMAASHSLMSFDFMRGGTVFIRIEAGRSSYESGDVRGASTRNYGSWDGSFRIIGAYAGKRPAEITETTPMEITPTTTAEHWRGLDSLQRVVQCPGASTGGLIWGNEIYADASAICAAAVHAGIIKLATGGGVTLRIEPGLMSYAGITKNRVRSDSASDKIGSSFSFPKEQVPVPRLVQGSDALPAARPQVEMAMPPAPREPPQERSGEYLLSWTMNAASWKGQPGRVITTYCPAGGAPGQVWGSLDYTSDSSVCTAAVHTLSRFDFASGGTVLLMMTPGQPGYAAEMRNGVISAAWGNYESSFRILGGVSGLKPSDLHDSTVMEISWATTATHLRAKTGERHFKCLGEPQSFPVSGSDVYTGESSICNAALHAGAITRSGGEITLKIEPARKSYEASTRNDVVTTPATSATLSFSLRERGKPAEARKR